MEELLEIHQEGRNRFLGDLEKILNEKGFNVIHPSNRRGIWHRKDISLTDLGSSTSIKTRHMYLDKVMTLLNEEEIPVYGITPLESAAPGIDMIDVRTPLKYFVEPVDVNERLNLIQSVKKAVDSAAEEPSMKHRLMEYSRDLVSYLEKTIGNLEGRPLSENDNRKLHELYEFRSEIDAGRVGSGNPLEFTLNETNFILNETFPNFSIDVVSTHDDYRKVMKLAKESRICWPTEKTEKLAKDSFDDFQKDAGTIIYSVSINGSRIAFGRDFVCFDKWGDTHLFIDILEGVSIGGNRYYHDLENWNNEWYMGGLKQGVLFNMYLANAIGVDYLTSGERGPSSVFRAVGAKRKRIMLSTPEGNKLYKLGKQAYKKVNASSSNIVKSYHTYSDRYYSLDMSILE